MPIFTVEAIDTKGKRIRAEIDAPTPNEALSKLKARGFKPTKINQKADSPAAAPIAEEEPGGVMPDAPPVTGRAEVKGGKKSVLFGRVKHSQLTQFTQQLSVLMDAGLPIVRSLKILSAQMKPGMLKDFVSEIAEDVETGSSLSDALAKHPRAFDKLYVNMVKAGEAGGVLDVILQRLSNFMERVEALKRKIIGASIYPAVVIGIAVMVVLAIMTFIVPEFRKVFTSVDVPMPAMTIFLMAFSDFCVNMWYMFLILPVVGFFGLKFWARTESGAKILDKLKLHMPLLGTIIRKSVISRFCRTLGTLLQSGVPILEALQIVKNAVGNEVIAGAIDTVHGSIREGESIADPLGNCGVFDDIVINMIDVGEETGELDKMLLKIADNYDVEVDASVSNLMSILEPVMIVGLGVTVGFIVVALFMPLISLLQGIK